MNAAAPPFVQIFPRSRSAGPLCRRRRGLGSRGKARGEAAPTRAWLQASRGLPCCHSTCVSENEVIKVSLKSSYWDICRDMAWPAKRKRQRQCLGIHLKTLLQAKRHKPSLLSTLLINSTFLLVSLDRYRALVEHGILYIFWKLLLSAFKLGFPKCIFSKCILRSVPGFTHLLSFAS